MVNAPRGTPVARVEMPLLRPLTEEETKDQVEKVFFPEGLVQFKGGRLMYYDLKVIRVLELRRQLYGLVILHVVSIVQTQVA